MLGEACGGVPLTLRLVAASLAGRYATVEDFLELLHSPGADSSSFQDRWRPAVHSGAMFPQALPLIPKFI